MEKDITITQDLKVFQSIVKMAMQNTPEDKISIVNIGPVNFNNIQPDNRELLMQPEIEQTETMQISGNRIFTVEECMTKIMEVMPDPIIKNIEDLMSYIAYKKFGSCQQAADALGMSYHWITPRRERFNSGILNININI